MKEILTGTNFVCHKNKSLQCAGFMILKGDEGAFATIAKRLFDIDVTLNGKDLIFDSKEDCIKHHKND